MRRSNIISKLSTCKQWTVLCSCRKVGHGSSPCYSTNLTLLGFEENVGYCKFESFLIHLILSFDRWKIIKVDCYPTRIWHGIYLIQVEKIFHFHRVNFRVTKNGSRRTLRRRYTLWSFVLDRFIKPMVWKHFGISTNHGVPFQLLSWRMKETMLTCQELPHYRQHIISSRCRFHFTSFPHLQRSWERSMNTMLKHVEVIYLGWEQLKKYCTWDIFGH